MRTSSIIGGVETWLDKFNQFFDKNGFTVYVGLVKGSKFNSPEAYKKSHPELRTIEVNGIGLNREGRIRVLCRCINIIKPNIVIPLGIADANEAVIRCK
ncbi:MAG: hypothetical protein ACKPA7_10110, partial [Sphaerospermopsis kisseleviana]